MTRPTLEHGDAVYVLIRYGKALEKRRYGKVEDLGKQGVRVHFEDGERLWLGRSQVHRVEVTEARKETSPEAPPTPAPPTPAPPPSIAISLDTMEAQGLDPMNLWLALGRDLVERARLRLEQADAAVTAADAQVSAARSLLADAERDATVARREADRARESLAKLVQRVAGEAS